MANKGMPLKYGRRICIFCGGYPTTKEHIWPDWLKKHIPRVSKETTHVATLFRGSAIEVNKTRKTGDPRAWRLRVTCARCNNGWISDIDNNVKDVLLRISAGEIVALTKETRLILAAWATRFTMVYEYAHIPTIAVSQSEREYFRGTREPPPGWMVFIGFYSGVDWQHVWNHRAFLISEEIIPDGVAPKPNAQSTILVLGHAMLNIISGPSGLDACIYASKFGLGVIWPLSAPTFIAPLTLDDAAISALVNAIGGPPFRIPR